MKKLLLLMVGVIVAFAAKAETVRFQNSANWSTVYIWAWDTDNQTDWITNNYNGQSYSWPGAPMTYNSESGYYEITFTKTPAHVIFNNGSTQTDDIDYISGAIYNADGNPIYEVFYLLGSFNSWKDKDENYMFSTTDGGTYTYTLSSAIEQGNKGWKINNGAWTGTGNGIGFGPESGSGSLNQTFNLSKDSGSGNIQVGDLPSGTVITLTYSKTGTSTLYIKTPQSTDPSSYIIYFYDQNNLSYSNVYAYVWGNGNENSEWPGKTMTSTGQYVKINDNYYPVWYYTFSSTWTPTNVIINGGDDSKKITSDNPVFVNNGFYTNGSNTATTGLTLVDKPADPTPTDKDFYLVGEPFGGWPSSGAVSLYKMTDEGNNHYTYVLENGLPNGGNWKITDGSWDNPSFGANKDSDGNFTQPAENTVYNLNSNLSENNLNVTINGKVTVHFYYKPDGVSTLLLQTTTEVDPDAPRTLYFHVKYDLATQGGENAVLKCHVFKYGTDLAKHPYEKNDYTGTSYETMTAVPVNGQDYSLWKYELTDEDLATYDAATFYFFDGNGGEHAYGTANEKNAGKLTDFIYATAEITVGEKKQNIAIQSYLSFDDFKALDDAAVANKGRENIYFIGWNDIKYYAEDNENKTTGNPQAFPGSWDQDLLKVANDHGCFYLPIQANSTSSSFKVSWINPKEQANAHGVTTLDENRWWATFDLGLIGVDMSDEKYVHTISDAASYDKTNTLPTYCRNNDVNGTTWFTQNKSVPFMNYNQANWIINSEVFGTGTNWLVIDTHTKENSGFACHTATVTSFNPQPSITVTPGQVSTVTLTPEQAKAMYDEDNPLAAANGNGEVYFTEVNKVSGTANITATSIDEVTGSGFTRTYSIYLNDALAGTIKESTGLTGIVLDYMPLSTADNGVAVRAEYEDKTTLLTFHSRTGAGTLESTTTFAAPGTVSLTGQYVAESHDEASGLLNFGVYVTGLDVNYNDSGYNGYSDFEFDGCSWTELLHSKSDIYIKAGGLLAKSDWTYDGEEDWSSYLRKEMTTYPAPVFLHEATQAQDINSLSDKTYTGRIYAVYPFIYNPGATLSVKESASYAPARVEGLDESTNGSVDYTGFKISNFKVPMEVSVAVPTTGAISGIGNVAVDAEACAAEYYTVSGIRVTGDPAPGIYIRRQGGKAEKVVIR